MDQSRNVRSWEMDWPSVPWVRLPGPEGEPRPLELGHELDRERDEVRELRLDNFGLREPYASDGITDRFYGSPEYFVCHFHDPVLIDFGRGLEPQPAGTTVVWEPGQRHHYGKFERDFLHSYLFVGGRAVDRIVKELRLDTAIPLLGVDGHAFDCGVYRILLERLHRRGPDLALLADCVALLLRSVAHDLGRDDRPGDTRIEELRHYLETNYSGKHSLEGLASRAHLSVPHLCALFRQCTGTSPLAYVRDLRLRQACHLLRNRALTVGAVADAVGYEDPYYFSRRFKTHVGVSPREYRRRHGLSRRAEPAAEG